VGEAIVACSRCGNCCVAVYFHVQMNNDDERWWKLHSLEYKIMPDGHAVIKYPSKCYWYDPLNNACINYEDRPQKCKNFLCDLAKEEKV